MAKKYEAELFTAEKGEDKIYRMVTIETDDFGGESKFTELVTLEQLEEEKADYEKRMTEAIEVYTEKIKAIENISKI